MSNCLTNHDDHGHHTDPGTPGRTVRALLGATLAVALAADAWVGPGASAGADACDGAVETYRLAQPGTYSAFVRSSSGPAYLEVRGPGGELLVASPSTATTAAVVDLPTAMRFGVPAPAVFEVESHVDLLVDSIDAADDLVLVRFGGSDEWSGLDVVAPATMETDQLDGCGPDGAAPLRHIRLDAVYSDITARQVFVISSHDRADAQPVRPVMRW